MEIIIILTIILIIIILLIYQTFFSKEQRIFQYDTNPYKRYCKICGQQQDQYTYSFSSRITWWEDIAPIKDEKCICHKYSKHY